MAEAPATVRVRVRRGQVFIGVRSTFQAVRVRACGGALRNPNQPRFIGRQPEARVYTERLKASASQQAVRVPISGVIDKIPRPVCTANHVFRVSRPLRISRPAQNRASFRVKTTPISAPPPTASTLRLAF